MDVYNSGRGRRSRRGYYAATSGVDELEDDLRRDLRLLGFGIYKIEYVSGKDDYPKLVIEQRSNSESSSSSSGNNVFGGGGGGLMKSHDRFQCLLIGCWYLFNGINFIIRTKQGGDVNVQHEFFDTFCANLESAYNGASNEEIKQIKEKMNFHFGQLAEWLSNSEELKSLLGREESEDRKLNVDSVVMTSGNKYNNYSYGMWTSIRLACLLYAGGINTVEQLSFIKKNKTRISGLNMMDYSASKIKNAVDNVLAQVVSNIGGFHMMHDLIGGGSSGDTQIISKIMSQIQSIGVNEKCKEYIFRNKHIRSGETLFDLVGKSSNAVLNELFNLYRLQYGTSSSSDISGIGGIGGIGVSVSGSVSGSGGVKSREASLDEVMMTHSGYIRTTLENMDKLNLSWSDATKLYGRFFEKEGFNDHCSQSEFVDKMMDLISNRRISISDDSFDGNYDNDNNNSRIVNKLIISKLLGGEETKERLRSNLRLMYDEMLHCDHNKVLEILSSKNIKDGILTGYGMDYAKCEAQGRKGTRRRRRRNGKRRGDRSDRGGMQLGYDDLTIIGDESKIFDDSDSSDEENAPQFIRTASYEFEMKLYEQEQQESERRIGKNLNATFKHQFISYIGSKFVYDDSRGRNREKNVPNIFDFLSILISQISIFWHMYDIIASSKHGDIAISGSKYDIEESKEIKLSYISKYKEMGLIDTHISDNFGNSIYHISAMFNDNDVLESLMSLDKSDILKYRTPHGNTPLDIAKEKGYLSIVQSMSSATMGGAGGVYTSTHEHKELIKETEDLITLNSNIVEEILKDFDKNEMEIILNRVIKMIDSQCAISDHLLLASFKYERLILSKSLENNRIWQALYKQLEKIFSEPSNRKMWCWFELYIEKSSIWYQVEQSYLDTQKQIEQEQGYGKILCICGEPLVLVVSRKSIYGSSSSSSISCHCCGSSHSGFDLIYSCPKGKIGQHPQGHYVCSKCCKKYQTVRKKHEIMSEYDEKHVEIFGGSRTGTIYDHIAKLSMKALSGEKLKVSLRSFFSQLREEQTTFFEEMIQYKTFHIHDVKSLRYGLRQDSPSIMKFPTLIGKEQVSIVQESSSSSSSSRHRTSYELKKFYDLNTYLALLIVIAQTLIDEFKESMLRMLNLADEMDDGGDKCIFILGPIKDIKKAQSKCELLYSLKEFPTSAHILDFIRCTLLYKDCQSLIKGIKSLRGMIDSGVYSGCIKKVLKIENMYLDKYTRFQGNYDKFLYEYNHIVMYVLIEDSGKSMIGEIQILLDSVWEFQQQCHKLEDVQKRKQFYGDMRAILDVSQPQDDEKMQETLQFLFHSISTSSSSSSRRETRTGRRSSYSGRSGGGGDIRELTKFLLRYQDRVGELLHIHDTHGMTGWHHCCQSGNLELFGLMRQIIDDDEEHLIKMLTTSTQDDTTLKQYCFHLAVFSGNIQFVQILIELAQKYSIDLGKQKDTLGRSGLLIAVIGNHVEMVKILLESKMFSILDENENGETLIHIACQRSSFKLLKYICDSVTYKSSSTSILNVVGGKYKRTPLNYCVLTREGYNSRDVRNCDNFKCFELLLRQDGINVNIRDSSGSSPFINCVSQGKLHFIKHLLYNNGTHCWKLRDIREDCMADGQTALHVAAYWSKYEVLDYLLSHARPKFDISVLNKRVGKDLRTPLGYCVISLTEYSDEEIGCDNFNCFKLLLATPGIDVNVKSSGGISIFLDCVWRGKLTFIRHLIDFNNRYDWTLYDIEKDCSDDGRNAIYIGAQFSRYSILEYFFNEKKNIFCSDISILNKPGGKYKQTPLHACIMSYESYLEHDQRNCDNWRCFTLLLSQTGIDTLCVDDNEFSPLLLCLYNDKVEYLKYLMDSEKREKYGWQVKSLSEESSRYDKSALMAAARGQGVRSILHLLSLNIFSEEDIMIALVQYCACVDSDFESSFQSFKVFLEQPDINVNYRDEQGYSLFLHCVRNNNLYFVRYLIENNGKFGWKIKSVHDDIMDDGRNAFHIAAEYSSWDVLCYLLKECDEYLFSKIETKYKLLNKTAGRLKQTPLIMCASTLHGYDDETLSCDNYRCFKLLLIIEGIDVNIKTSNGDSAFLYCVFRGKLDFVQHLIEHDINKTYSWQLSAIETDCTQDGRNAIYIAAQFGHYSILKYLFQENLSFYKSKHLNKHDSKWFRTPLMACVLSYNGHDSKNPLNCDNFKCFKLLLSQKEIDINIQDESQFCVRLYCVYTNKVEYLKYLLNPEIQRQHRHWKVESKFSQLSTKRYSHALMVAARTKSVEMIYHLISLKIFSSQEISEALNKFCEIVKTHSKGVKVDLKDEFYCFKSLLKYNVNLNFKSKKNGCSAFLQCVKNDNVLFVRYLLKNFTWKMNSLLDDVNNDGENALQIATKYDCSQVLPILKPYFVSRTDQYEQYEQDDEYRIVSEKTITMESKLAETEIFQSEQSIVTSETREIRETHGTRHGTRSGRMFGTIDNHDDTVDID